MVLRLSCEVPWLVWRGRPPTWSSAGLSLIEVLDKISKGPANSDRGKLIGVSDKNEALDMCHVEREHDRCQIVQRRASNTRR